MNSSRKMMKHNAGDDLPTFPEDLGGGTGADRMGRGLHHQAAQEW